MVVNSMSTEQRLLKSDLLKTGKKIAEERDLGGGRGTSLIKKLRYQNMMENFASFYVPVNVVLFHFDLFGISMVHVPTNAKKIIELYYSIVLLMFLNYSIIS